MDNNPVFRNDYEYDSGSQKNLVVDGNSFYSISGEKATFWVRNRHWFCLVGGLVVGCLLTICISYPFYSMGMERLMSKICSNVPISESHASMLAGLDLNSLIEENKKNFSMELDESLERWLNDVFLTEMFQLTNRSIEEIRAINESGKDVESLIRSLQDKCDKERSILRSAKTDVTGIRELLAYASTNEMQYITSFADTIGAKLQTLSASTHAGQVATSKLRDDIVGGFEAFSLGTDFNFGGLNVTSDACLKDCLAWQEAGATVDGVFCVKPDNGDKFKVYCDMTTDGGGWLVFQKRIDGTVNFFLGWQEYEDGFGDVAGEYWLGNKYLHRLTQVPTELRVDLMDWDGEKRYAKYSSFKIGDAGSKYRLDVGTYSGNAGDSLEYHHGVKFSTKDVDNSDGRHTCALRNKGAWWYKRCSHSSLNGEYLERSVQQNTGINWQDFKGDYYSLKRSSMMLRRT